MAWTVDIDGNDITQYCQSITWRPKWGRPASCSVRVPSQLVSATIGQSELHLYNGSTLHSGTVWFKEDTGDADTMHSEITSYDHLIYLPKRMFKTGVGYADCGGAGEPPCRQATPGPCNLANPTQVILDEITAPAILAAAIQATTDCDPGGFQIIVGSVAGGGPDMTGLPADWPMDIATLMNLLMDTGQLGVIVNPGFGSSTVDLTNGGVVTDRTGSVSIQYATGGLTARDGQKTQDMDEVTNALWYLLGPKMPQYTGDVMHWAGSITPTASHRFHPDLEPPGANLWPPALVARWTASRANYGYMQEIQVHDSQDDEQTIRPLFEEMFANEAYVRAVPRTIVSNSPNRTNSGGPSFFVGDLISVSAGSGLGGGFTGAFRVYSYDMTVDADGVTALTNLVGSADQE